jgi:hypothetical protein
MLTHPISRHFFSRMLEQGNFPMTELDDDALKAEIDEIMSMVDAVMDKVARIIPEDKKDTHGQE